jgi:hypothetical protein
MTETTATAPLVHVQLLNFPLQVYARTQQHFDGVMREFALLSLGEQRRDSSTSHVPSRLLDLAEALRRYDGDPAADLLREEAIARGDRAVDLSYDVPAEVGPHLRQLHELLDQADEYCASEQLLTLAMPEDMRRFRVWYLTQFTNQIAGLPPEPWTGPSD